MYAYPNIVITIYLTQYIIARKIILSILIAIGSYEEIYTECILQFANMKIFMKKETISFDN